MEQLSLDEVFIDELLFKMVKAGYSDLYLEVGNPPCGRARATYKLDELKPYEAVRREIAQRMLYDILSDEQITELEDKGVLIFSYFDLHGAKFGVHVTYYQANVEAIFHLVPSQG